MGSAIPVSHARPYRRIRETNATDTSFASRPDTATEPSGNGVYQLQQNGIASTWLMLVPYGTGDADDAFDIKILGWRKSGSAWTAVQLIGVATCTLGTKAGVAGGLVAAAAKYCDTIASVTLGVENVSFRVSSPADNTAAYLFFDTCGCDKIEVLFDSTTGDPTGMNALVAEV